MVTGAQLSQNKSKHYEPSSPALYAYGGKSFHRPFFNPADHVPQMLTDSRVEMALWYIKGTLLANSRFWVRDGYSKSEESPSEVKQFIVDQINCWWAKSVIKQLTAMEWGYSVHESFYAFRNGMWHFSHLRKFNPIDCHPLIKDGELVGAYIAPSRNSYRESFNKNTAIYIGIPKLLWHVQGRQWDEYFGRSRLASAYRPWLEKEGEGGATEIRELYFYKHSFQGEIMYYPAGSSIDSNGKETSNRDLAREFVEKKKAGGSITLPGDRDEHGQRRWELESMEGGKNAADVLAYPEQLKDDIAEGVGVPKELIEAAETGSGYSGRRIPKDAFCGMLSDPLMWLVNDFDEQSLRHLVKKNFGIVDPDYDIIPFGLVEPEEPGDPEVAPGGDVPESAMESALKETDPTKVAA